MFTPMDRIGQLTMRNWTSPILVRNLVFYTNTGLLAVGTGSAVPQLKTKQNKFVECQKPLIKSGFF